jgi:hypothetical protein
MLLSMASDLSPPDPQEPTAAGDQTAKGSAPAWRSWLVSGVVAALVAAGVGYFVTRGGDSDAVAAGATSDDGASAETSENGPGGGFGAFGASGEIQAVDGSTLTIEATNPQDGSTSTVVVSTSDDTTFTEMAEGDLGDVVVGDTVVAITGEDGTTVTALIDNGDDVAGGFGPGPGGGTPPSFPGGTPPSLPEDGDGQGPPGPRQGGAGNFAAGTVTAIDGDRVTIEAQDGTSTTVTVPQDATVSVTRTISLADLAVGASISATPADSNDTADDGSIAAGSVRKGDAGFGGFGGPGGFGPPGGAGDATG